jgi:multidrug efflux pump subunit AcrA (membrane-fusion protein)
MNARLLVLGAFLVLSGKTSAAANEKDELAQRVDLRARATGYLVKVNFKAGDMVTKGDVLFEIDDRVYRAHLELTEAQFRAAEARLQLCDAQLKRAQNLFKKKAISAEEVEKCAADRAVADADRQAAQATRTLAQLNLQFTKVSAPINGKIGRALVTEGNLVKADDTLLATIESPGAKPSVNNAKPRANLADKKPKEVEPTFGFQFRKVGDAIDVVKEPKRTLLVVTSESGIGDATILLKAGQWPENVTIRFQHGKGKGFESLEEIRLTTERVQVEGSKKLSGKFGFSFLDAQRKPAQAAGVLDVPVAVRDGAIEVTLPACLFIGSSEVRLKWVDAFR